MRDTGASVAGVRKSFVHENQMLPDKTSVQLFDGSIKEFPTAKVHVESPFYTGDVICCVIDTPPYDLVLGNVDGTKKGDLILASVAVGCVTTRAQKQAEKQERKPLRAPEIRDLGISRKQLVELQKNDPSLRKSREAAQLDTELESTEHRYVIENEILYRIYKEKNKKEQVMQIMVPQSLRLPLLSMAHECLLAGHGGRRRTTERLYTHFFWPGIHESIKEFCRSCERCQKTAPRLPNVPLEYMPCITEPFSKIAVDITGPFTPPSDEGHRYVLSIIDIGTRFPEAVPLKNIDTRTVAEEILKVCARMGFPKEIQSDNGSQFSSEMMKEVYRLMSISPVFSSPYHAQSNGVVERFHGTMKPILRKLTEKQPKSWHTLLPILLYACRDVPNVSTGFTPFELLFGRRPRGPLDLIAEQWTEKKEEPQTTTFQYIHELKEFFQEAAEIVESNIDEAAKNNKKYRDRGSKPRKFEKNDEVLLLVPDSNNKLLMTWKGPFKVLECKNNDYEIEVNGKKKLYHANLLKKYYRRQLEELGSTAYDGRDENLHKVQINRDESHQTVNIPYNEIIGNDFIPNEAICCIASVFVPDEGEDEMLVNTLPSGKETIEDAKLDEKLTDKMKQEMRTVLGTVHQIFCTIWNQEHLRESYNIPYHCLLQMQLEENNTHCRFHLKRF